MCATQTAFQTLTLIIALGVTIIVGLVTRMAVLLAIPMHSYLVLLRALLVSVPRVITLITTPQTAAIVTVLANTVPLTRIADALLAIRMLSSQGAPQTLASAYPVLSPTPRQLIVCCVTILASLAREALRPAVNPANPTLAYSAVLPALVCAILTTSQTPPQPPVSSATLPAYCVLLEALPHALVVNPMHSYSVQVRLRVYARQGISLI